MKRCSGPRKVYRLIQQRLDQCHPKGRHDELVSPEVGSNNAAEKQESLAIEEP